MFFSTVRFVKIRLKVTRLLRGCFVYWVQNTNCFGQTQFVIFQDDEIQLKNNMKNQDFINSVQVIYLELKKISNLFITLSSVLFYKIQSVFFRLRLIKKRSRQQKFNKVQMTFRQEKKLRTYPKFNHKWCLDPERYSSRSMSKILVHIQKKQEKN